jgi:MscS family membrane protein
LREILDSREGMHPDFPPRVYFKGFNDWSLNILMVAWYHPADYWAMQEWQQRTCLTILKRFNEEGIDFAFPSQTVYVANDDSRQLKLQMLKGEVQAYHPEGAG